MPACSKPVGVYCSTRTQTFWIYEFFSDSLFEFRTQGHFGNTITKGNFSVNGDTLTMKPYSIEKQPEKSSYFKSLDTLLITSDTTLISITGAYHYCMISDGLCCNDDPRGD